jgi:phenylacetate-CoA ligase
MMPDMNNHLPMTMQDPERRERRLIARLPELVKGAKASSGWNKILHEFMHEEITSRTALTALPITRKSDLHHLQQEDLPFGGLVATPAAKLRHIFMSPGPIFEPEGCEVDWWRFRDALVAAGFKKGDVIQNCFSYHFTPAAFMVEGGAQKIGCPVIPAGVGQTELQVVAMSKLRPAGYTGTPSFLRAIVEKAGEMGADVSSVQHALVTGEALPASLRIWLQEHGVKTVLQAFATADVGTIAYETLTDGQINPGMVVGEDLIVEIVNPITGQPVEDGMPGELIITSFNPTYPLIRFGTGDLTARLPGSSPCGRTNTRIKGWLGRADQATKVRGMFVHPAQITEVMRRHPEIIRAKLVVSGQMGNDQMCLHCELSPQASLQPIVESVRSVTKLRCEVISVPYGSLSADSQIIEDARSYE